MTIPTYDPEQHILLRDEAHKRCIWREREFAQFVGEVQEQGMPVFTVMCPDWPPVKRTPLPIIVFSIGGSGGSSMGGPTADMTWEGQLAAVSRDWENERKVRGIAREMAPDRMSPPQRVAYAWQVDEFDPSRHVVIRYWCRDHDVSIVDFWLGFYPDHDPDRLDLHGQPPDAPIEVINTTNPELDAERASGSYSPTRRCVLTSQLYLLRNYFLGANEGPPEPENAHTAPAPQPRAVHDGDGDDEEVVWDIHEGAAVYSPGDVMTELAAALGRDPRPFSGTTLDSRITAITREAMTRYLAANPVDQRQYIRDSGGRNFDCDDFAITLRSNLIRDHGYNACGVVAGDVHAWCFFVVVGEYGPEIVFIEPQTDGLVENMEGNYSVDRRCEVLL